MGRPVLRRRRRARARPGAARGRRRQRVLTNPEPRLLFLGHGAERTGPPIFLRQLLGWLDANTDARLEVAVARDGPLLDDYRRHAGVLVASHHAEPAEPVAAALRRAGHAELAHTASNRWLRHRLRRIGHHDLVYVNTASPVTVQLLDHLPPEAPGTVTVVAHVHELDIGLRHNLAPEELGRLLAAADQVIAVSEAVATNLIEGHGVPAEQVHVHHGFIDTTDVASAEAGAAVRRRLGIGPDAFVLGSLGLPDWRKAPDLFLRVGWLLRQERPDLDLHLLWTGGDPDAPDRWQLDHEAAHLGLGDRTHFVPDVKDPGSHLAAMDVFALTSREDAYPLAGLEAAAAGVPIVCFDTGGMPELVQDDAGAVVPYPSLDAFAAAVLDLADDPDRRHKQGAIARQRVQDEHDVAVAAPRLWADLKSWLPA